VVKVTDYIPLKKRVRRKNYIRNKENQAFIRIILYKNKRKRLLTFILQNILSKFPFTFKYPSNEK